ncbi:MAG TPA: DUF2085 domain-containing protein [Anaerolineaceae bacterium]|nr:DUF2085 domain-containing protein [Anaerolineaceae bacterium]
MITVTLYRSSDCPLCDQVQADLDTLQASNPHRLAVVDIDTDPALQERYRTLVPLVQVGPYRLKSPVSRQEIQVALGAAADRVGQLEQIGDKEHRQRLDRGHSVSKLDRFSSWFSTHYMVLINAMLLLYVGLPFLAPVLAKSGMEFPARVIYTIYKPLCHQLAFRSWFLFGPQPAYPLELADVPGLVPYEEVFHEDHFDITFARGFIGNDATGYKVAICERDVAIYGVMALFGIVFALTGRRIKAVPWYVWLALGVVPVGFDGVSQLPAFLQFMVDWLPARESTPLLRTITGGLFGLMTAWYLFPMIESSMRETRVMMSSKVTIVDQLNRAKHEER